MLKCENIIGLMCLKKLMMSMKPMAVVSVLFVVTGTKINFRFQSKVFNCCQDLMQMAMSFSNVAIVSVKENDYRIRFCYMKKEEAINIRQYLI